MHISKIVTKAAIITINAGIRILSGIKFFTNDIATFEQIRTNAVASPIPMPFSADEVVPKVGHIPNNRTNVGFSLMIPFSMMLILFIISSPVYLLCALYDAPL